MDQKQFEALKAAASECAAKAGVVADLQIREVEGSSIHPAGPRVFLTVMRLVSGQEPQQYAGGNGYRPDVPDLKARIERDILSAAKKLHEVL